MGLNGHKSQMRLKVSCRSRYAKGFFEDTLLTVSFYRFFLTNWVIFRAIKGFQCLLFHIVKGLSTTQWSRLFKRIKCEVYFKNKAYPS